MNFATIVRGIFFTETLRLIFMNFLRPIAQPDFNDGIGMARSKKSN